MKTPLVLALLFGLTIAAQASADGRYGRPHGEHLTITAGEGYGGSYFSYSYGHVTPRRSHERVIIHHVPPIRYAPFGIHHHEHRYYNDRYDRGRYDRRDHHYRDRHDNRRNDHHRGRGHRNHYK